MENKLNHIKHNFIRFFQKVGIKLIRASNKSDEPKHTEFEFECLSLLFSRVIPVYIERSNWHTIYACLSPDFDETMEGESAPFYTVEFTVDKDKKLSMKLNKI